MDQSASRSNAKEISEIDEIGHTAPVDKESTETITKSNVDVTKPEQETNQEVVKSPQTEDSPQENKTSPKGKDVALLNTASTSAKSKIPGFKRNANNTSLSLLSKNSPRTPSTQRSTQKNDSKISLAKKDSFVLKNTQNTQNTISKPTNAKGAIRRVVPPTDSKCQSRSASTASTRNCASNKKQETETNLRKIASTAGDQNRINLLEKKLITLQTEFLKQVTVGAKENSGYRFIALERNDECKLLVTDDHLKKMPQLPVNSVSGFKEKIKNCMDEYWATVKDLDKETAESEQSTEEKLQEIQDSNCKNLFEFIDDLCKSYKAENNDLQIQNMQKELQETKKALRIADQKVGDLAKQHEEQLNLKNDLNSKSVEELARKEAQIKELQKKIKSNEKQTSILKSTLQNNEKEDQTEKANLKEELKMCHERIAVLNKKLVASESILKEVKAKHETIKTLEANINDMSEKMEEQNEAKLKAESNAAELSKKIKEMQNSIQNLETEKSSLQKETSTNLDFLKKLQESETRIKSLEQQLAASEKLNDSKSECPKDIQIELSKLRQSDAEKRIEIEKLKVELKKSVFNVRQLEEQIQRDQQLLEVRSELINSLQTNETNQRLHMEELFVQVGEKNTTINELNNELSVKSDEFRNLFNTISNKQLELSNQEHMIKLLEESNERSQLLRVKQEEKIGRMEEDIAHLKQTIAIYQSNALNANGKLLFAPIMPRSYDECNENFYHYTSERKRKRQIDINVKKYEA